jgi:hypothetical protein
VPDVSSSVFSGRADGADGAGSVPDAPKVGVAIVCLALSSVPPLEAEFPSSEDFLLHWVKKTTVKRINTAINKVFCVFMSANLAYRQHLENPDF